MPDPSDPREAALNNIQDSSRAYGRGRRRGDTANVDPAFAAALEITDPEQRRAALAQYARQRAQALFPNEAQAPAPVAITPRPQDPRMQAAEDKRGEELDMMAGRLQGRPEMAEWQSAPMPGDEDSPETHSMLMDLGRELAMSGDDRQMAADVGQWAPDRMSEYQNIPMVGAEDSPEQYQARQAAGKRILAPTYNDQVDARNERNDTARIESRNAGKPPPGEPMGDGIDQIQRAVDTLGQQVTARRRRR
jgi:hypothetical protein